MSVPSGCLSLNRYTGADRDALDINGELNKLAFNIRWSRDSRRNHFPSSTVWSILLGEQIGISVLKDRAKSYNEPFKIPMTSSTEPRYHLNPGHRTYRERNRRRLIDTRPGTAP